MPRCPSSAIATISSDVAIGRRMKGSEMFMGRCPGDRAVAGLASTCVPGLQPVLAADHDALAGREPLVTTVSVAVARPCLDRRAAPRCRRA